MHLVTSTAGYFSLKSSALKAKKIRRVDKNQKDVLVYEPVTNPEGCHITVRKKNSDRKSREGMQDEE